MFFGPAVDGLKTAVLAEGWPYLLDVLDAYWPENSFDFDTYPEHDPFGVEETDDYDDFPPHQPRTHHRHRQADDPDASFRGGRGHSDRCSRISVQFHRHPGDEGSWIDSMSYGWEIGHPNHPVGETIETLVDGEYEIWVRSAIEHAMHADQPAATSLLVRLQLMPPPATAAVV